MTLSQLQEKALELPVSERLQLAEVIWDNLEGESETFPLTDAQRQMLDQRRAEFLANPESALTQAELLLRVAAQGEADVQAGRTFPQSEVFEGLRARLAGR